MAAGTAAFAIAALLQTPLSRDFWMVGGFFGIFFGTILTVVPVGISKWWVIPRLLGDEPELFLGRSSELEELNRQFKPLLPPRTIERLSRRHHQPRNPEQSGPAVLWIHGQVGVGKSVLARVYARRIAKYYPDGQLYANLRAADGARDAGEVLGEFLDSLREPAITLGTEARADKFRSLTAHRRMLIILDGAQSVDQLREVLPNGRRCAVIVTSRRSISNADLRSESYLLGRPNTSDALEMLRNFANVDFAEDALSLARIVEYCGRLPLALRSAGEQIAQSKYSPGKLADILEPEKTRLEVLSRGGRILAERLTREYAGLGAQEKRAFRYLALVNSPTFLPWVLGPLLDVGFYEASDIIKKLGEVQLVQATGRDQVIELRRYRLHPLVRSFAMSLIDRDDVEQVDQARKRLEAQYLNLIKEILGQVEPDLHEVIGERSSKRYMPPEIFKSLQKFAELPDGWVREEYGNLIHSIEVACHENQWRIGWKIAAYLGGCVPLYVPSSLCLKAFKLAIEAASTDQAELGCIQVRIANGAFLVALEHYAEAFEILGSAGRGAISLTDEATSPAVGSLAARSLREEGAGWLQLGSYESADMVLKKAISSAISADDRTEIERDRVLVAENDTSRQPEHWHDEALYDDATLTDDQVRYHARLGLSEAARRRGSWLRAQQELSAAMMRSYGDARRRASVEYRFARLRLSQWRATLPGAKRDRLAELSLGHAATALLRFRAMENDIGAVRARCIMVRALIAAGLFEAALTESARAADEIGALIRKETRSEISLPIVARWERSHGEALLANGRAAEALQLLQHAARAFDDIHDWHSRAEVLLVLGRAQRQEKRLAEAEATLSEARVQFKHCQDNIGLGEVLRELALTTSAGRRSATAREYERMAHRVRSGDTEAG
jgi:hypothetical protein